MAYGTKKVGAKYSTSYKVYITENDKVISPFHDISLYDGDHVVCVNEIPRFERAKFEISKSERFNPIMQDVKKGAVRFVHNVYPFYGYQFNYGAIPQTWEDPNTVDPACGMKGDNDPIDVLEIGSRRKETGDVYRAKVIGALGLIDDGEADWKIVVIDSSDPMADQISDIEDVKKIHPELLKNAFKWMRDYKVPDGKPRNEFAFDGEFQNAAFAKKVIKEGHANWQKLMKDGFSGISLDNATQKGTSGFTEDMKVEGAEESPVDVAFEAGIFSYIASRQG